MTTTAGYQEALRRNLWAPFTQMAGYESAPPLLIARGQGSRVWDTEGREYLDAHAGLWLVNVGYGRQEVIDAAARQLQELAWFSSFAGFSHPRAIELAERLVGLLRPEGMGKVFFAGSGSEAVETALKIVRQYWRLRGQGQRYKVISRWGAYHGVTFGATSAGGMTRNRKMFEPLVPGFRHIAPPYRYRCQSCAGQPACTLECAEELRRALEREGPETVAAFIGEPVMGAGGVIIPHPEYWRRIREICDAHSILLIADEVITGFGRTGSWFGSRAFGVRPDLMTFAKGLTSGYVPLGAVAVRDAVYEAFLGGPAEERELRHGNTYAGHPVACAAALATLDVIEREALPEHAGRVGGHLLKRLRTLERFPIVGDVDMVGLLGRVELVRDRESREPFAPAEGVGARVARGALGEGLIVRPLGDVISLSPPLVLTEGEADRIVDALAAALSRVCADTGRA